MRPNAVELIPALEAVERTGDDLEALVAIMVDLPREELQEDEYYDFVAHLFPFDQERPGWEIERAFSTIDDPRMAEVFLRGLFLQYGYDNATEPERCMVFWERFPELDQRESAFGLANGIARGLAAKRTTDERADLDLALAVTSGLHGLPRTIFLEEQAWQLVAGTWEDPEAAFAGFSATLTEDDRCVAWHGFARATTGCMAELTEASALAERAPPSCRMHVLHGAQRQRCPTPIHLDRGAHLMAPCGITPEDLPAWAELDPLP